MVQGFRVPQPAAIPFCLVCHDRIELFGLCNPARSQFVVRGLANQYF